MKGAPGGSPAAGSRGGGSSEVAASPALELRGGGSSEVAIVQVDEDSVASDAGENEVGVTFIVFPPPDLSIWISHQLCGGCVHYTPFLSVLLAACLLFADGQVGDDEHGDSSAEEGDRDSDSDYAPEATDLGVGSSSDNTLDTEEDEEEDGEEDGEQAQPRPKGKGKRPATR